MAEQIPINVPEPENNPNPINNPPHVAAEPEITMAMLVRNTYLPDDIKNLVEAVHNEGKNWTEIFDKKEIYKLKPWMTSQSLSKKWKDLSEKDPRLRVFGKGSDIPPLYQKVDEEPMLKEMIVKIDEKIDELKLEMVGVTVDIKELKKKLLKKDDENTNKDADDVDKDADDVDDDAAADA
ncbi:hypothetical protein QL285_022639 [Trifolium repens]|nr:hypothetical protein QL285_022639 [Trifolium repens]